MVDLEVEIRDGDSGAKKRFFGVSKQRNRWRARVRNPMLKVDVELGCYGTPEEAAFAVQKKKAEGADSLSMGSCRGYFKRKKFPLPRGVLLDNGVYRVHLRHPKLKKMVSGGSYKTCEEAVDAANRKREEFQKMLAGTLRAIPDNEDDDEVFKKPESLVASKSGCSEEQTGDVKVPPGAVTIKKPDSKARISFGTDNTVEEAISSFNKKKAELDAKLKKPEFDCVEFRPGSEATETPMKIERKFWYDGRPTSLLDAHNLENFAICDKSSNDCDKVDIPAKLENGLVDRSPTSVSNPKNLSNAHAPGSDKSCDSYFDIPAKLGDGLVDKSPTSVFDPKNLNNAPGSDKSCDSGFDRAVSLGIINEYGQLQGKYSELDKRMGI